MSLTTNQNQENTKYMYCWFQRRSMIPMLITVPWNSPWGFKMTMSVWLLCHNAFLFTTDKQFFTTYTICQQRKVATTVDLLKGFSCIYVHMLTLGLWTHEHCVLCADRRRYWTAVFRGLGDLHLRLWPRNAAQGGDPGIIKSEHECFILYHLY